MRYDLMVNFNRPLIAKSITDFWQRWHISLTTWFRDYLFFALPAKKNNKILNWMLQRNILITYLLMGLWHGANWNFLFFGVLHGLALSYEIVTSKWRKKLAQILPSQIYATLTLILTFAFINFTYIVFRANTIADAFYIVSHLLCLCQYKQLVFSF